MAGLKNIGVSPVFVQSAKVMFTADGAFRTDTNWNTIDQNTTNGALVNNSGASIGWKITVPASPDWDIDASSSSPAYGDFSAVSLDRTVYTYNPGDVKVITFSSIDALKSYKVRIASYIGYQEDIQKTLVTVNGVTKLLANDVANTPFYQEFDLVSGSASLAVSITTQSGSTYASFCAIILEEYTT